jgi:hypothetical protein
MSDANEDFVYELQQALAALPSEQWSAYLEVRCPADPALRQMVVERQRQAENGSLRSTPAFVVRAGSGGRGDSG